MNAGESILIFSNIPLRVSNFAPSLELNKVIQYIIMLNPQMTIHVRYIYKSLVTKCTVSSTWSFSMPFWFWQFSGWLVLVSFRPIKDLVRPVGSKVMVELNKYFY